MEAFRNGKSISAAAFGSLCHCVPQSLSGRLEMMSRKVLFLEGQEDWAALVFNSSLLTFLLILLLLLLVYFYASWIRCGIALSRMHLITGGFAAHTTGYPKVLNGIDTLSTPLLSLFRFPTWLAQIPKTSPASVSPAHCPPVFENFSTSIKVISSDDLFFHFTHRSAG